jgi:hypothetical protein
VHVRLGGELAEVGALGLLEGVLEVGEREAAQVARREAEDGAAPRGHGLRDLDRRRLGPPVGDEARGEPAAVRLGAVHRLPGEAEFGQARPVAVREDGDPDGGEAGEADLGEAEARGLLDDDEVAGERQLGPAPEAGPADGRHRDEARRVHPPEDRVEGADHPLEAFRDVVLHVHPGAEGLRDRRGDHRDGGRRVLDAREGGVEGLDGGDVEDVEGGPVQPHDRDAAAILDPDGSGLRAHRPRKEGFRRAP